MRPALVAQSPALALPALALALLTLALLASPAPAMAAAARNPALLHRQLRQTEAAHTAHLDAARHARQLAHDAAIAAHHLAAARDAAQAHLRQTDASLAQASAQLQSLRRARTAIAARMAQQAAGLSALLPVMLRLSAYPTATLLAVSLQRPNPGQAGSVLDGALVLRGLSASMEQRAAELRAEQSALVSADAAIRLAEPKLLQAQAAQQAAAAALARQWHNADLTQHQQQAQAEMAAEAAAAAAARAHSLRAAIAALEAMARRMSRMAQDKEGPGLAARSGILPVAGRVVRGFGVATSAGPSQGISIAAASAARVVAPCSGRAVFAAPFRSYGKMVILDCGPHTHLVLAGLEELLVRPGQKVRAGMPVGRMPNWSAHDAAPRPALYLELRRGDQAVNPTPYLAAHS